MIACHYSTSLSNRLQEEMPLTSLSPNFVMCILPSITPITLQLSSKTGGGCEYWVGGRQKEDEILKVEELILQSWSFFWIDSIIVCSRIIPSQFLLLDYTDEETIDGWSTTTAGTATASARIIDSVESICRDTTYTQYMPIQKNLSKSQKRYTYKPL